MELFLLTMKRLLFLGFLLLVAGSGTLSKPQESTIKNNDVNECLTKLNCGPNEECANTSGSFRCECRLGFESSSFKDKIECYDEDECKVKDICGNNSVCNNTFGSYSCQCKPGYKANSVNFTAAQGGPCRDINECEGNAVICGPNAMCDNSIGSYHCECISGFVASNGQERFNTSQNVTCDDINECLTKPICGPDATCVNSIGSYHCECNSGFMEHFNASQNVTCEDINECLTEPSCGHHATCVNSIGSYHCECDLGFVASNGQERFNKSQKIICNELKCNRLDRGNFPVQTPVEILQILDELKSTCMQKGVSGEELLQILIDALESFREKTSFTESETVTAMFQLVEATLPLIGQLLVNNKISQSFPQTRVEMLVKRQPSTPQGTFTLSTNAIQFSSHWDNAVGESYPGFAAACLFEYADMKIPHVNSIINNDVHKTNSRTDRFELNSRIVTIKVTNPNTARLMKPVTLQFSHLKEAVRDVICVFWDSALEGGVWSNKGCIVVKTNINYTVCSCNHLSSFAVLMALYEQKNVFELQLITWIGLGLSLICLLICILTFWLVRSIQSTRTIIHLHLCVSLFIADFIFLVGISQTENKAGCAVVAGLLHYFFLAVFCWMSLEGIQLFRMVVLVFNTTLNRGYLMAAGYGVPALIVIVSATANYKGYGTPRYCWLNLESGFIWSFFAPVCIIIVVNAIFFLITVSKLAQKFNSLNPDVNNLRKIKTFTITAIAQLCVLGTMWIFGCFQFDEGTLVMSYLFTILNSFQGVLVFIMHCLLSKQVRDEYIRFLTCLTTRQKSSYSEFSTNQSSKSQTSKNSQNTGESKI